MKIDKSKSIFLLGGHDLDMLTIRELLDKYEIVYKDKNLTRSSKLSDYKKERV